MCDVQRATRKLLDVKHGVPSSPLVVMTNFQKSKHHELVVTLVQNLFPSVNPHTVDIKHKRRVVLFDYDAEHDLIRFRHYRISIPVSGLSKAMKTLLYGNGIPDLGDLDNMSEFLSKSGCASVLLCLGECLTWHCRKAKARMRLKAEFISLQICLEQGSLQHDGSNSQRWLSV